MSSHGGSDNDWDEDDLELRGRPMVMVIDVVPGLTYVLRKYDPENPHRSRAIVAQCTTTRAAEAVLRLLAL